MSGRSTTFLAGIALACDVAGLDAWASLSSDRQAQLVRYFNNAVRWAWRRPKDRPWSDAVKFAEVTVESGGYIAWSSLEYAENWRLWSDDPRPYGNTTFAIDSTVDSTGVWPLGSQLTTLWAEYLPRVPIFSSTAWSGVTAYVQDDAVYYTDGNCYRCLVANTNVTPTSDSTKWQVQPVLNCLQSAIAFETAYQFKRGITGDSSANQLHADAEDDLQDEWIKDERPHVTRSFPPLSWR